MDDTVEDALGQGTLAILTLIGGEWFEAIRYGRRNKGFAQGFLRKATRATIVFRGYNRYFGGPRGPGVVRNRVNLSFLSTALDPQADVILFQSYEGFMPIFRFYKNRIFGKKL